MTRWRGAIAALGVVVCLAIAALVAFRMRPESPALRAPASVPATWAAYRTSLGHVEHVGRPGVACKDCHDYGPSSFSKATADACPRCHAREATQFHRGDDATKTDCLTCHAFAPEAKAPTCIQCHAEPRGPLAAIAAPARAHATADCASCHRPHDAPFTVQADCRICHGDVSARHGGHEGTAACVDCHRPHAPALAALETCAGCHDGTHAPDAPRGAQPAGHASCATCHRPHEFAADPDVCASCHGEKPTLMAATAPAHRVCTTCHEPHAPGSAAASCAGCHAEIRASHGGNASCVSCHAPHSDEPNRAARPCTSCHAAIAQSDDAVHRGGARCEDCHRPHGFDPPATPAARLALCSTCHVGEARGAGESRGHQDCRSCHGTNAHKPDPAPPCASCHRDEGATAPPGHRDCLGCHEPHRGAAMPEAARCTGCHKDKVGVPHGPPLAATAGAPTPPACTTCHRPHGPKGVATPPSCTTCHTRDRLPALHGVAGHADCASCHTSHAAPRSDRATCTSTCHTDRRTHQPQAPLCRGCHAFRD